MTIETQNTSHNPPERLAYRVREFCPAVGISVSTFWKMLKLGEVRAVKVGGRVVIPVAEVHRLLGKDGEA